MKNNIDGSDINVGGIDEDIKIVEDFIKEVQEEYSETLVDGKVYRIENIPIEFKPTKELAKSISNVLKALKSYREDYNHRCQLAINRAKEIEKLNSELETYKKIAEKLAEVVDLGYMPFECSPMCIHDNCIKECTLDWARKEVENEENNSNT